MAGLRQRIANVTKETQIGPLMAEGRNYLYASAKTRRRWQNTAETRREAIRNGKEN